MHFSSPLPTQPYLNYRIIGVVDNFAYISDDVSTANATTLKMKPSLRILKKNIFDNSEAKHFWKRKFKALGCWDCDETNASLAIYGMSPNKEFIYALATKIVAVKFILHHFEQYEQCPFKNIKSLDRCHSTIEIFVCFFQLCIYVGSWGSCEWTQVYLEHTWALVCIFTDQGCVLC
jgi:hypothetical protein